MDLRVWAIIILVSLSIIDLGLTAYYVSEYRSWQPETPYNLIEHNPLLVFLWNKMGFWLGMFVGSVIILSLIYIITKHAHWIVVYLLLLLLIYTLFNNFTSMGELHNSIEKYPDGKIVGINELFKRNVTKEINDSQEETIVKNAFNLKPPSIDIPNFDIPQISSVPEMPNFQ